MTQSSGSDRISVGAPESPDTTSSGLTRREVLKRGAILGGAIAWSVPAIQAVGMTPAYAAPPSPGCVRSCMVWTPSTQSSPSHWDPYDGDGCTECDGGSGTVPTDVETDFVVTWDTTADTYTVTFPSTYTFVSAAIRHGETLSKCAEYTYGPGDESVGATDTTITLASPGPVAVPNEGYRIELTVDAC